MSNHYECRDCGHPNGVSAAHCPACKADALAPIEARQGGDALAAPFTRAGNSSEYQCIDQEEG